MTRPQQITLEQWERRYHQLKQQGMEERFFGGSLCRHVTDGDTRLLHLKFDNSPAALALWNLLLSENQRLRQYKAQGKKLVAAMKDLGTIPVMAYSFDNLAAFYPDGAWWTPCLMEQNEGLFKIAAQYGLDERYCPVRAMFAAFLNEEHFPRPDLLISSAGAICDDFSSIAQRLEHVGFGIHWWEVPRRREPLPDERGVELPGDLWAARSQVEFVRQELQHVRSLLEDTAQNSLTESKLAAGIQKANLFRRTLGQLRQRVYTAPVAPIGSLEMLVCEMLAIHFCSDYDEALAVVENLLKEVCDRINNNAGVLPQDAAHIFWVNPVADLRAMNLLEECGGRVCGTEFLFSHALDLIPEEVEPMEALARTALADPMVGSTFDRAGRIQKDMVQFGAEGVIISRIPGASHCAYEGRLIGEVIRKNTGLPVVEIEVPTLCDPDGPAIRTRLEALIETIKHRRKK